MIVEAQDKGQFVALVESVDKEIYVMYQTAAGDIIYRPTVTSKGRDTFVLMKQSMLVCDEIEKWYGKVLHIKGFSFKEDIMM